MYSYQSHVEVPESNLYTFSPDVNTALPMSTNKYVYVKQNFISPSRIQAKPVAKPVIQKVLVNPHFTKKIFVNPNFKISNVGLATCAPKIHVNPNVQKLNIGVSDKDCTSGQKIHVNPNVLRNIPISSENTSRTQNSNLPPETNKENMNIVQHTENKLRSHVDFTHKNRIRKRRTSVRSKFKIIKSSLLENSLEKQSQEKRRISVRSKYKIVKYNHSPPKRFTNNTVNKFKLDNRSPEKTVPPQKNKKYVYVNRFLSISDIARNNLLRRTNKFKKSNLLNVSGVMYKKSPNCLRRMSITTKPDTLKRGETSTTSKSKFKFVKKSTKVFKDQPKLSKSFKVKKTISPGKLRICNIPCPYFRKYGRCKGKDNGKCYRKHDPDQIALCTKFLQGACIDKKCLLSHNVSPEKMPTCKFYLEGSCSRDDCPYLHVRINPKAEICRDFLVGFCKKASQCDKRHQFLCPDYEKNGSCLKQRCQYPHGAMVRKYSVFNKNKFAKKSSKNKTELKSVDINKEIGKQVVTNCEHLKTKTCVSESCVKNRYYVENNFDLDECKVSGDKQNCINLDSCHQENGIRSRPKLGKLPSFIAFEEV